MAVRAGNTVYLRGQTAMDLDGRIVGIGDAAAQTENAMKCAKVLLEEAGAKLEDIVKVTIYITDRAYREPVYQVVGRWLKGVYPVSTGLIVQGLGTPRIPDGDRHHRRDTIGARCKDCLTSAKCRVSHAWSTGGSAARQIDRDSPRGT